MIGLGRMGQNMVVRLAKAGHQLVVNDRSAEVIAQTRQRVEKEAGGQAAGAAAPVLQRGDILIDGGNSYYVDDIRRSRELAPRGIQYVDVGTSGGVWGLERGYCLMIGGPEGAVKHLDPIFRALAPGRGDVPRTPGREKRARGGTAEDGYLHCGPSGAGHFVKMVHNGIEYGIMQAYAEGFDIFKNARAAEYEYAFDLPAIAELWRHGSVVRSWLLDLAARALHDDPQLARYQGRVADSGEGRWTLRAAIDLGVPMPALAAALFARFESQGNSAYAAKLLSALREQFGGHMEKR
jgi:6-phosphogluconate dehydrogenase